MKTSSKADLLRSLQTENAIVSKVIDFVICITYNRPNHERIPGNSRYALLFVKRENKKAKADNTRNSRFRGLLRTPWQTRKLLIKCHSDFLLYSC